MLIGYARVSTKDQETDLQLDALRRAGVEMIYQEKASSVGKRPELQRALSELMPGDVLMVYKMDRIARSLKDLLLILERITGLGASIRSLTEPLDTTGPLGMFMVQILGAVAQLERSIIRERAIAGQVAARERGVTWGGKPLVITDEQLEELVKLYETGQYTWQQLGATLGQKPKAVYRALARRKKRAAGPILPPVLGQYLSKPSQ